MWEHCGARLEEDGRHPAALGLRSLRVFFFLRSGDGALLTLS